MKHFEANFDGLVGPTHNYAGLSFGNVASFSNAAQTSNPKAAAKQGLQKAKSLADLGMVQGVLAPQERPDLYTLRRIGFSGSDAEVLQKAAQQAPALLNACCSASSMWTANAATVSPSADTRDGKVHFTPANLVDKLHRSIEPVTTGNILQATFNNDRHFKHHQHLPEHASFGDEGAANHTRLCAEYGHAGVELFVYGQSATNPDAPKPKKYPARQTLEASQAVARLHQLEDESCVFMQQNPDVIDQGVFHNDVISVGNQNVLFYHEQAFLHTEAKFDEIRRKMDSDMHFIKVATSQVSIDDAVKSYLFNTQIITLPSGEMAIIAPTNCQENPAVFAYLNELITLGTPIKQVRYFDVKQSMQNGGGPACLRLRVAMNQQEVAAVNQNTLMNDSLFTRLNTWVDRHYRDQLTVQDLADPQLIIESRTALDELTQILKLGSVYQFQK
ncbi:N-succinylarginine dihydrolase [Shewanella sp. SR43-4]|jgi:succinylarginine dihydrolase|uniref:N-succinylarginine dihydrolase n=1 Tax=Shewanella TaxID=22 RepID=UPI0015F86374|nr:MULTISPECIES: N-succinylarginine dihydrolase [unclassified Shewanella]MBB1318944.1 N-succinylarginine dihydrolase [Shewanella sp. SR43-4]MBB1388806.1 N-succinylarginine dihydrolase [Shewanella sp. SG44-6]MBB1477133.1 N-succinylarginine dihydrolase [Shewanella sp. SG41-3]|tara:strand:- start:3481 stop:4815 length:1335 start_codon:yes stop_codon:yes gene_type:complete